ncbi:MAG: glycosyltransferase family 2 protein [Alphaproteobacteria bacterium]|nr:glycosyltransferase family 2 protein [Alphaproteobacteria bacterium]
MNNSPLSAAVIVPAYNEEDGVADTIQHIRKAMSAVADYELIIVNDGSSDGTAAVLEKIQKEDTALRVVTHDNNLGYGAALKTGIRNTLAEYIVITDADGTYPNERIPDLIEMCRNYDMVVGARTGDNVTYSKVRALPKIFLRAWASWIARKNIPDINSGMRVFRRDVAERFMGILPNTFSFTLTITLALLTTHRRVMFAPIDYHERVGNSKIKPIRDTLRFLMLILRTGTYFAPLRVIGPFALLLMLAAMASLAYDIFELENLTDKTIMLLLFAFNTGMFALIADMIDKRAAD